MKNLKLLSLLLAAAFAAGCAGTARQSGSQSAGTQKSTAASSDAEIVAKLKAALAADPELSAVKIDATSNQGVVRLKGEIKSMALRKKVESIARGIAGVQSIDNQMVITG